MKLTVLGKYGPFPAAGGSCSGYLVQSGGSSLLLDLGSGALSNLARCLKSLAPDCIVLSHLHSDHMADMLVLRYALEQYCARGLFTGPVKVVCPSAPDAEFALLNSCPMFSVECARDGMSFAVGDMQVTLHAVQHPVPCFASRVEAGGKSMVYTGDTRFFGRLHDLCQGAGLLLADAAFLAGDPRPDPPPHMTAAEVGRLAADAHVQRLLCTHIWGGGHSDESVRLEAAAAFPQAEVAQEMASYEV